ncbi:MAG: iron ABC transporter permease [Butyrivibrio sp.]|nr:iron ABC transporter permease [Butyrivibrio sp.]
MVLGRYTVNLMDLFDGQETATETVIFNIRLPRVLLAVIIGAGLSLAGCTFQTVFTNPMASPDILGASSGACFGAALALLMGASRLGVQLMAFAFGLFTVGIVYFVGNMNQNRTAMYLILVGIIISSLFNAGTSFIKLVADPNDQLPKITYWTMGSLSNADLREVFITFIPTLIVGIILFFMRWKINLLTLSDDEAESMGVDVRRLRMFSVILASVLTAVSVSAAGMIGWIGLVIPNLVRMLTGNNTKQLMPMTAIIGGIYLLIVDDLARCMLATEIPIGILTAFVGAPFFIFILLKNTQ